MTLQNLIQKGRQEFSSFAGVKHLRQGNWSIESVLEWQDALITKAYLAGLERAREIEDQALESLEAVIKETE